LKAVVDENHDEINTTYLKYFIRAFSKNPSRMVSFLSPIAGIGFPGKPVLHPQLFRSIQLVRGKSKHKMTYCITGAYPDWGAYENFLAPLLMKHKIVISRPFDFPTETYEESLEVLERELESLRHSAEFTPPDYEKILMK
jgi:hypothetical protein